MLMTTLIKKPKYKLTDFTEKDFPLFLNEQNEENHILHTHDFTELVIVEHGKSIHFTETFRHMIVTGDVLVIPKGIKHGYEDTEMLKLTNIIFDMSLFDSLSEDIKHIPGFYSLFLLNSLQQKKTLIKKAFYHWIQMKSVVSNN